MSDMDNTQSQSWFAKNKTLVVIGAVILTIVLIAFGAVSYHFKVTNEGEKREQDLITLYGQSLISLGTCLDKGKAAAQVTEKEFETIRDILVGTAAARYEDKSAADAAIGGGQLFSMVQEAYPQIDQSSWKDLQVVVVGCRDEFKGTQDRIQENAGRYRKWYKNDNVFNAGIKNNFPSRALVATKPDGTKVYARDALDYITHVVTVKEANTAFQDGELGEQDLFGNK